MNEMLAGAPSAQTIQRVLDGKSAQAQQNCRPQRARNSTKAPTQRRESQRVFACKNALSASWAHNPCARLRALQQTLQQACQCQLWFRRAMTTLEVCYGREWSAPLQSSYWSFSSFLAFAHSAKRSSRGPIADSVHSKIPRSCTPMTLTMTMTRAQILSTLRPSMCTRTKRFDFA